MPKGSKQPTVKTVFLGETPQLLAWCHATSPGVDPSSLVVVLAPCACAATPLWVREVTAYLRELGVVLISLAEWMAPAVNSTVYPIAVDAAVRFALVLHTPQSYVLHEPYFSHWYRQCDASMGVQVAAFLCFPHSATSSGGWSVGTRLLDNTIYNVEKFSVRSRTRFQSLQDLYPTTHPSILHRLTLGDGRLTRVHCVRRRDSSSASAPFGSPRLALKRRTVGVHTAGYNAWEEEIPTYATAPASAATLHSFPATSTEGAGIRSHRDSPRVHRAATSSPRGDAAAKDDGPITGGSLVRWVPSPPGRRDSSYGTLTNVSSIKGSPRGLVTSASGSPEMAGSMGGGSLMGSRSNRWLEFPSPASQALDVGTLAMEGSLRYTTSLYLEDDEPDTPEETPLHSTSKTKVQRPNRKGFELKPTVVRIRTTEEKSILREWQGKYGMVEGMMYSIKDTCVYYAITLLHEEQPGSPSTIPKKSPSRTADAPPNPSSRSSSTISQPNTPSRNLHVNQLNLDDGSQMRCEPREDIVYYAEERPLPRSFVHAELLFPGAD